MALRLPLTSHNFFSWSSPSPFRNSYLYHSYIYVYSIVPPTIENHPGETILLSEGQQLKIGCKASGRPLPHVSWYRDAVNKEMELTQAVGSSEYIKERVESGDEGNYICIARSNASEDQFTVQVIVQCKPKKCHI